MKLNKREIAFLSKEFPGTNQLSLLTNIQTDLNGTEANSLEEKGVLKGGKVTDEWSEILEIIKNPQTCARIVLKDNEFLVEKYAYKNKGKIVLAENEQGEMIISLPKNFDDTILELAEFTGMSNVSASNVEALLPINEVLVLLAVTDLYRNSYLRGFLGDETKTAFPLSDIQMQVDTPAKNSLLKMLVNNYNLVAPASDQVEMILAKLQEKNIIHHQEGYTLHPEFEAFAVSILIPQTIVTLEAFQIDASGVVVSAGALCVTAGIKDALAFVFAGDEIEISSITGGYLLKIVENFLNCPELI